MYSDLWGGGYQANKEIQNASMRSIYCQNEWAKPAQLLLEVANFTLSSPNLSVEPPACPTNFWWHWSPWWAPARPQHHVFTRSFPPRPFPRRGMSHPQSPATLGPSFSSKCCRNYLRPSSWLHSTSRRSAWWSSHRSSLCSTHKWWMLQRSHGFERCLRQLATRECWPVLDLHGLKLSLGSRHAITPLGVTNAGLQLHARKVEHPQHLWSPAGWLSFCRLVRSHPGLLLGQACNHLGTKGVHCCFRPIVASSVCGWNWRQAPSLMPSFLDTLSPLGMQINGKS